MNHDYAHCADYNPEQCPKNCFRAELVIDYRKCVEEGVLKGVPVSWMNLRETDVCPLNCPKRTNGDRIRAMTDEELAAALCLIAGGQGPLPNVQSLIASYWLDWLKQEAKE